MIIHTVSSETLLVGKDIMANEQLPKEGFVQAAKRRVTLYKDAASNAMAKRAAESKIAAVSADLARNYAACGKAALNDEATQDAAAAEQLRAAKVIVIDRQTVDNELAQLTPVMDRIQSSQKTLASQRQEAMAKQDRGRVAEIDAELAMVKEEAAANTATVKSHRQRAQQLDVALNSAYTEIGKVLIQKQSAGPAFLEKHRELESQLAAQRELISGLSEKASGLKTQIGADLSKPSFWVKTIAILAVLGALCITPIICFVVVADRLDPPSKRAAGAKRAPATSLAWGDGGDTSSKSFWAQHSGAWTLSVPTPDFDMLFSFTARHGEVTDFKYGWKYEQKTYLVHCHTKILG